MSTTFEVYPRTSFLPSFTDIIQVAQRELHGFFHDFGISYRPTITVEIGGKEANGLETVVLKAPAIWPDDAYAWFQIPPVKVDPMSSTTFGPVFRVGASGHPAETLDT